MSNRPKGRKRLRDLCQRAKLIIDIAVGKVEDQSANKAHIGNDSDDK
jgi:hypothetical protein